MNLSDRVRLAWRVITASQEKSVATLVPDWKDEKPTYSETNFENLVRHGWRKNELIFACVNKKSNSAAQVALTVRLDPKSEPLLDHPLKRLIQAPNPFMSESDLWKSVIIYQAFGGRAAYEIVNNRAGKPAQLWPLRPDWLAPIRSSSKGISGYEYTVPGITKPIQLAVEDVLDFNLFDPLNKYHGWPPARVAARVGDVDNSATDFIKLIFDKGGMPPGYIKSTQRLIDTQVADIRRRWSERYGGYEHWLAPAVLDADAEWKRMGMTFEEMGFEFLDARNEARICAVLDVPPILVGAKMGLDRATYANYREARLAWWQDTLLPLYADFEDALINQLAPRFGDPFISWDFSRVPAFKEERNILWTRATAALQAGAITVNEFCAEVGLPDKGPAGNVYIRSLAQVEVPAKMAKASVTGYEGKAAAPADEAERRRHERVVKKSMNDFFEKQLSRVKKDAAANNGH